MKFKAARRLMENWNKTVLYVNLYTILSTVIAKNPVDFTLEKYPVVIFVK